MFETTNQKSQYLSHSLRPETKSLGLSIKNETASVKSQQKCLSYYSNESFLKMLNTNF